MPCFNTLKTFITVGELLWYKRNKTLWVRKIIDSGVVAETPLHHVALKLCDQGPCDIIKKKISPIAPIVYIFLSLKPNWSISVMLPSPKYDTLPNY